MTDTDIDATTHRARTDVPVNPLEALKQEIAKEVTGDVIVLEVPKRPGWTVRYRCDVEMPLLSRWRKAAADRQMPDGLDELKLCLTVLANQCDALLLNGQEVEGGGGELLTFASKEFLDLVGVGRPIDAVKRWYGVDGHVLAAAQEVLTESGFGDEATREDPTPKS
jgi:hypothetical protein